MTTKTLENPKNSGSAASRNSVERIVGKEWVNGHPESKGWYVTRDNSGHVKWRAWGSGCWWNQLKDGWIGHYNGCGEAHEYEWQPKTKKDINLDEWDLPLITNNLE